MIANWKYKTGIINESYFSHTGRELSVPRIGVWFGGVWYSGFKSIFAAKLFITKKSRKENNQNNRGI